MREHLYKAKIKKKNDWISGSLIVMPDSLDNRTFIQEKGSTGSRYSFEVLPETVCQSFRVDENAKHWFIGDQFILKSTVTPFDEFDPMEVMEDVEFTAKGYFYWNEDLFGVDIKLTEKPEFVHGWSMSMVNIHEFQLTGRNIHDKNETT